MNAVSEINDRFSRLFAQYEALVCGQGMAGARLMLVGEAPGAQEEKARRPFVGAAGKNLDAFLVEVGLARGALYITNAVKFRPSKAGKGGRLSNRTPTRAEVLAFMPWLEAEMEAVSPDYIITLGNTALFAVTGERRTIGDCHGTPLGARAGVVFPLYHPASVIYRRELMQVYREDLAKLRGLLGEKPGIINPRESAHPSKA